MKQSSSSEHPDDKIKDGIIQIILHESSDEHFGLTREGETHWNNPEDNGQLNEKIKQKASDLGATISESNNRYELKGMNYYDGGTTYNLHYLLTLTFGAGGIAVTFLTVVKPIILQWMKNRGYRSIKIKKDGVEIEIKGSNDVDDAMAALKKLLSDSNKDKKTID